MSIFLKARRTKAVTGVLVLTVALVAVLSGMQIPALNILGGGKSYVPVGVLLPLLGVAGLVSFMTNVPGELEITAVRPVQWYNAIAISVAALSVLVIGALLGVSGLQAHAFAAARNLVGYMGLAMLGQKLVGRHAAILFPVVFAFGTMTAGRRPGGHPWPWAWPLFESEHVPAALVAVAVFLVGLLVTLSRARPVRRPRDVS
ncbi:hypothetical protein [Sphaerisporangium sp. NPDC051011]|uniref:hypothetical protein n=1 Tax=Sphaerisporangium sp. NPDC051011 TaxID=3155792 RepID=UPI0033EACD6D